MALCTGRFETGVSGNNIATGDTGDSTAWDTISLGTAGTAKYDSALAHRGSLSGKLTRGSANACFIQWDTAFGTQTDHYGRAYVYLTANPGTAFVLIQFLSGAANACQFRLLATGQIAIRDQAGNTLGTTTNVLTLNQWVRLEWHIIHSTTVGFAELVLYNTTDSTTPTETLTTAANKNFLASSDRVRFQSDQNASYVVQYDDLVAAASFYPGPAVKSQALNATVAWTASVTKQIAKTVSGSDAWSASVVKQITKTVSGSDAWTASITRQTGKTVSAGDAWSASIVRQTGKTVSASDAWSASVARRAGKAITATVSWAGSLVAHQPTTTPQAVSATVSWSATITMFQTTSTPPLNWGAFRDTGRAYGNRDPSGVKPHLDT